MKQPSGSLAIRLGLVLAGVMAIQWTAEGLANQGAAENSAPWALAKAAAIRSASLIVSLLCGVSIAFYFAEKDLKRARTATPPPPSRPTVASDQKDSQSASTIRSQRNLLELIFDTAEVGLSLLDGELRFLRVNRAFAKCVGRSVETFRGQNFADLILTPDQRDFAMMAFHRFFETGEPIQGDMQGLRGDGERFDASISTGLMQDDHGRRLVVVVLADVSDRKRDEREIEASHRLINSIREAQIKVNVDEDDARVFEKLLSLLVTLSQSESGVLCEVTSDASSVSPADRLRVRAIVDSIAPLSAPVAALALETPATWAPLEDGLRGVAERRWPVIVDNHRSGQYRIAGEPMFRSRPVHHFLGLPLLRGEELIGVAGIVNRKGGYSFSFAEYLQPFLESCAGIIEAGEQQRGRKQAEHALQNAKETAERADRTKSAFLATISHEIRNPMNALLGMTELLMSTNLNQEQLECAGSIRNGGRQLMGVIDDIWDLSKLDAKHIEMEPRPFRVRDCVESALELAAARAAEKNIELACVLDAETPPLVEGDETRLKQVLCHLIGNAVKFTHQGEIIVSVAAEPIPDDDSSLIRLRFTIRDTGIGIPANRMHLLFQSFSQIDDSIRGRYGGSGLGLAISQRLVELMGGEIRAQSRHGEGASFQFTIRARAVAAPGSESPPCECEKVKENGELAGKRILVVENHPLIRDLLASHLAGWGVAAVTASDLDQASALIAVERPDAALVDWELPESIPDVTLERIRSWETPLIAMTGQARAAWPPDVFAARLSKPIRLDQMRRTLIRVLSAAKTGEPSNELELGDRCPLQILIAEDLPINQQMMRRTLERFGYRPDLAADGAAAIRALERKSYDVVLMDIQMPEMNGLEATRRIVSRWPESSRPRIIAFTANAMMQDRQACLKAGMSDFLAKPAAAGDLMSLLEKSWILRRQSLSAPE